MPSISSAEIQALLDAGRVVEACTLLTMHGGKLEPEEWQALESRRQQLWSRASALIAEGQALEQEGKNAEALQCYQQVAAFAADFPGIDERCRRVEEALTLANAVRLRSKRIRGQAGRTKRTSPAGKTRTLPALLIAGIALLGLGSWIWWFHGLPGSRQERGPTEPTAGVTAHSTAIPPRDASPATQSAAQENQKQAGPGQPAKDPAPVAAAHPRTDTPARQAVALSAPQPPAPKSSEPSPAAAAPPPPAQNQAQPQEKTYTVQPGDSLSKIAQHLFCDENLWQQIHALNRDQVKNPDHLAPGIQIRLNGIESRCRQPQ